MDVKRGNNSWEGALLWEERDGSACGWDVKRRNSFGGRWKERDRRAPDEW